MDREETTPDPVGGGAPAGAGAGVPERSDAAEGDGEATATEVAPVRRRKRREPSPMRNALEWVLVIAGAVIVALLVRNFVVQSFKIPSPSMSDTLVEGDRVLVNRLSYRLHDVNRGDVIVFDRPESWSAGPSEPDHLIKRVIGLPGDVIESRDGQVYIDGAPLEEPYLDAGQVTKDLDEPVTIAEGEVFVMGDNRVNSDDSRYNGTVSIDLITGRAFTIVWPLSRFGGL